MKKGARHFQKIALTFAVLFLFSTTGLGKPPFKQSQVDADLCAFAFQQIFDGGNPRSKLENQLAKLGQRDREVVRDALDGLVFMDQQLIGPELLERFKKRSPLKGVEYPYSQDTKNFFGFTVESRLEDLRNTRTYLRKQKKPFSYETLKEIHGRLTQEPSSPRQEKDKELEVKGLTALQQKAIKSNPYLHFEGDKKSGDGVLQFTDPSQMTKAQIAEIGTIAPELAERLTEYSKAKKSGDSPSPLSQGEHESLLSALTQLRLAELEKDLKSLGKVKNAKDTERLIQIAAEFYRDMMTISPFETGNSEVFKMFLNEMIENHDLPPPRLFDIETPYLAEFGEWEKRVRLGVQASQALENDLLKRLSEGLEVGHSAEWVSPAIPREIPVYTKTQGRKVPIDYTVEALDPEQFWSYLSARVNSDPKFLEDFKTDPNQATHQLYRDYLDLATRHRVNFESKYNPGTIEELSLPFIERDYIEQFGKIKAGHKQKWDEKIDRWHERKVTWRGLPYYFPKLMPKVSEKEILSMFTEVHPHNVANNVRRQRFIPSLTGLKGKVYSEFDRHNEGLVNGGIVTMAKDHSETGPGYDTSWGFSTSYKQGLGRSFAMGAMVVAPLGQQGKHQEKLRDRLNVAYYRGKKDVDLSRLKQMENDFSYKYFRQAEVMGVGAVDPDSVMAVQRVDDKGNVVVSYVRNADKPHEVWKVEGDFTPEGKKPPKDRLLETIILRVP